MAKFWILIFVLFFATNSLDKAESVQLIDEIFGEGWWDNDKADEWHKLTLDQNFHHQIDRQNTQIEPNSTDQNRPLTESDHSGQIAPNSTDQNRPLTESDHSDNVKNGEEQNETSLNENIAEDERKRKIIDKFNVMKDDFKQKRKHSTEEWTQIEEKIGKHLKVNRKKIYKWKKEFGLSRKVLNEKERKHLVKKFGQMKAELKRNGLKNSFNNELDKIVAKELGLNFVTIYKWKSEFGQAAPNGYSHSEQKELMKRYYEIKANNPKISDEEIVKMLKIGRATLVRWKKQFKRQQCHQNSVNGHSVDAAANVHEIENSYLENK